MILLINGSPRKVSSSLAIGTYLINLLNDDFIIFNAYELHINSCTDCRSCSKKAGCSIKDDMEQIYDLITKCDTFIITSPIYFGSATDQIMKIINRFQTFYAAKYIRHSNDTPHINSLITISTAGGTNHNMFNGLKITHNILKKLFYIKQDYFIGFGNTDKESPLTNKKLLKKLHKIK